MKPKQMAALLEAFAIAFGAVGAAASEKRLKELAKGIKTLKVDTLESLATFVPPRDALGKKAPLGQIGAARNDVAAMALAADKTSSKTVRQAINSLERLLFDHADMGIESFFGLLKSSLAGQVGAAAFEALPSDGETLVDAYARELDDSVHDPEKFPVVFSTFKSDPRIKKADVIEVANRIVYKMPSKTTRDEALTHILKRHKVSEGAANKVRSLGGKSAA